MNKLVFRPNFEKRDGLITVVVQNVETNQVLMVAYSDEAGWLKTLKTGCVSLYSTSRKKSWVKGEESGNFMDVQEIFIDCDGDAVVYRVSPRGDGVACHTKAVTCFYRRFDGQEYQAPLAGEKKVLKSSRLKCTNDFSSKYPFGPVRFANRPVVLYYSITMVITHHGGQCFKVSFGDTTLVFDPISKKSKLAPIRFGADIAFVSLNHPDFNGTDELEYGSKKPFVIDGPGEYEVGEVTVRGYGTQTTYENVPRYNTIYQVTLEGINIVFLGAQSTSVIDSQILSELDDIDILFIPIGGGDVLDVPEATKLGTKLEARCIIPMHYNDTALKAFFKEEGIDVVKPIDKLTIKKKDFAEMEGEIVVLGV